MRIRIQLSHATVKDLYSHLQHAYQRDDVWLVRRTTVGLSFHKARLVSDPRDAARRPQWLPQAWPTMRRAAERRTGLSLCEDEARVAQWGSLSDTWARRGQPPVVHTRGTRKGATVFGTIA